MNFKLNESELRRAIDVFGDDAQFGMLQEECAELIVAINKKRRGSYNWKHNLFEEIADTIIVLEQILIYFDDNKTIQEFIDIKMGRVTQRIDAHNMELGKEDKPFNKNIIEKSQVQRTIEKTPAELIDALITVDIKCFMAQDNQANAEFPEDKAKWGQQAMELNRKRNNLMRALDVKFGLSEETVTGKTYHPELKDNLESEF